MILEHKGQAINNLILPEQLEEIWYFWLNNTDFTYDISCQWFFW
jgi:hypothetical protein